MGLPAGLYLLCIAFMFSWFTWRNNPNITSEISLHYRTSNILTGVCGLSPGDRVIVILPRIPQWWLINIACIRTGKITLSNKSTANTDSL